MQWNIYGFDDSLVCSLSQNLQDALSKSKDFASKIGALQSAVEQFSIQVDHLIRAYISYFDRGVYCSTIFYLIPPPPVGPFNSPPWC